MTQTIKLSNDGGVTFINGRLEMIGLPNEISPDEINQRTRIRFETAIGFNKLHPHEGFNYYGLMEFRNNVDGIYPVSIAKAVENHVRFTMSQDPHVDLTDTFIEVADKGDRVFEVHVRYSVKGSKFLNLEFYHGLVSF